ncbi:hypothetical protein D3C73_1561570 [compost metagenome]
MVVNIENLGIFGKMKAALARPLEIGAIYANHIFMGLCQRSLRQINDLFRFR